MSLYLLRSIHFSHNWEVYLQSTIWSGFALLYRATLKLCFRYHFSFLLQSLELRCLPERQTGRSTHSNRRHTQSEKSTLTKLGLTTTSLKSSDSRTRFKIFTSTLILLTRVRLTRRLKCWRTSMFPTMILSGHIFTTRWPAIQSEVANTATQS